VEGVHNEDRKRCLETYSQAFDQRQSFEMEYRIRRNDGEYRWILDTGVPRFNADGTFAGYIGSCLDITDRKLAEEALASVGRRLIEAHEEERAWIGRELHDDIVQRIALVAIELERCDQQAPDATAGIHDHIRQARQRLFELGEDIQELSHHLHSSKLEYLGLVTAAKSFCHESSEQRNVRIEFNHSDVPATIPKEISLCLFRVLQEALQNAVKHSADQNFTVELRGTQEGISLAVRDSGIGFDWQDAMNRRGLGLISMRERLRLVNGELTIKSEPGRGTTVLAHVPLGQKDQSGAIAS
jgi:signal transduction histidine kinase